jgi:hypothetical protein
MADTLSKDYCECPANGHDGNGKFINEKQSKASSVEQIKQKKENQGLKKILDRHYFQMSITKQKIK